MPPKTIDERIADKIAAQQKLSEEIAKLKSDQAKKQKAEREKTERQLGRLAMESGLDQFTLDEVRAVFQKAESELLKKSKMSVAPVTD